MSKTPCCNEHCVSCSCLNLSKYLRSFGGGWGVLWTWSERNERPPTAQNPAAVIKFPTSGRRRSNDLEIERRFNSFLVEILKNGSSSRIVFYGLMGEVIPRDCSWPIAACRKNQPPCSPAVATADIFVSSTAKIALKGSKFRPSKVSGRR